VPEPAAVPDWQGLAKRHPPALVAQLQRIVERGGTVRVTPGELAADTAERPEAALALLRAAAPFLHEEEELSCQACDAPLESVQAPDQLCSQCGSALGEVGRVVRRLFFVRERPLTRDVRWVLALHGMNTSGPWQESFNWLVSRSYRRMVPVAIYKYGIVRPGVLLRFRQRRLTTRLLERIAVLSRQSDEADLGGAPDVIAHSFGTWLLGHALWRDPTLRVGRVILTGCILRPDFDWATLVARNQVEAVLNHFGTRDFWAGIAHYLIPDAGPAGRRGCDDEAVINVRAEGLGHSDFFGPRMDEIFRHVWQVFLRLPGEELATALPGIRISRRWRQAPWLFRAMLRLLVLVVAGALALIAAATFVRGAGDMSSDLLRWWNSR
jgi:hypothetical protein